MASVLGDDDLWCVDDVTADFRPTSGREALAQSLYRRWTSDRGSLIDDPNYGTNLTDFINDDATDGDIANILAAAIAEANKDERVIDITGTAELGSDGILLMEFVVTDGEGPFTMTLSVSQVTVELLTVTEAA